MDLDWCDPARPWWVKLRRASFHLDELGQAVALFKQKKPWRLDTSPGRQPGEVSYRFRIAAPIPTDLAVIAGEIVHDLRSALDTVVYDLVNRYAGPLTAKQERAPAFKSSLDEDTFRKETEQRLKDLCGPRELAALRSVQPFAFATEAKAAGANINRESHDDLAQDIPYRLDVLWNVDKHRRLLALAWYLDDLVYWPEAPGARWYPTMPNTGPLSDGTMIGYFNSGLGNEAIKPRLNFFLRLTDDPCPYPQELSEMLTRWHESLGGWVVPRLFITASSDGPPPILIPGGWPYR
jgi:hypothetical protein